MEAPGSFCARKLDSPNFFQNATGRRRVPFRQNQSAPVKADGIIRKQSFFFADYEGTRIRQQVPRRVTQSNRRERASASTDFSD